MGDPASISRVESDGERYPELYMNASNCTHVNIGTYMHTHSIHIFEKSRRKESLPIYALASLGME